MTQHRDPPEEPEQPSRYPAQLLASVIPCRPKSRMGRFGRMALALTLATIAAGTALGANATGPWAPFGGAANSVGTWLDFGPVTVKAAAGPVLAQTDTTASPAPELPSLSAEPVALALALDAALNAGDVDAAMNLFDDAALVKIPPDLYTGASQIRNWVSYLAANHFASEPGLRHLGHDTITWPAEVRSDQLMRFGISSLHGEATLSIAGDKITNYTFVLTRDSASQLRSAQIAASDVLQDPLVVGADFANVYGFTDVFRAMDGTLISYRDLVGAEPGSGPYYDLGGQPVVLRTGI
jgi:hypothetical protein